MGREREAQLEEVRRSSIETICIIHTYLRLSEGGVACPEVVLLKKHVLVMSFIGHDQVPAPTLKEAPLSRDQLTSAYQQCIQVSQHTHSLTIIVLPLCLADPS